MDRKDYVVFGINEGTDFKFLQGVEAYYRETVEANRAPELAQKFFGIIGDPKLIEDSFQERYEAGSRRRAEVHLRRRRSQTDPRRSRTTGASLVRRRRQLPDKGPGQLHNHEKTPVPRRRIRAQDRNDMPSR